MRVRLRAVRVAREWGLCPPGGGAQAGVRTDMPRGGHEPGLWLASGRTGAGIAGTMLCLRPAATINGSGGKIGPFD